MGGYDKCAGCNSLDLSIETVCNTVEEIEHSEDNVLIKSLYVENNGAACDEVVCYGSYLLVGLGTDNLKLYAAGARLGLPFRYFCFLYLGSSDLCSRRNSVPGSGATAGAG